MPILLDADPNSPTFNCYSTLIEAIDYHSTRLQNDSWVEAGASNRNKSLMWATRQLDTLLWRGSRTFGTQNKEFPRKNLSYWEGSSKIIISETEVPKFLKDATAELAMYLLEGDTTAPSGTEGFSRIKVDTIELEINSLDRVSWLSKSVKDLVWRFLANSSKYTVPVVRVG